MYVRVVCGPGPPGEHEHWLEIAPTPDGPWEQPPRPYRRKLALALRARRSTRNTLATARVRKP